MPPKVSRPPTLQDKIKLARSLEEEAAVYGALSGYLQAKYLPTDARQDPYRLDCKGSPISTDTIQGVVDRLHEMTSEVMSEYENLVRQEVP